MNRRMRIFGAIVFAITMFMPPAIGAANYYNDIDLNQSSDMEQIMAQPTGNWSYSPGDWMHSSAGLGDLNNDGLAEIVFGAKNGVFCIDCYGSLVWEYALSGVYSPPVIADLFNDGNPEILASTNDGYLYCISSTGTLNWVSPYLCEYPTASPGVVDLDGDGNSEIIASGDKGIFCLDRFGNIQWNISVSPGSSVSPAPTPAIDDLDGDGYMDIIWVYGDRMITRVNHIGQVVWSYDCWPNKSSFQGFIDSPAVGDLDGDGNMEILVNVEDYLICLNMDGQKVWKFDALTTTASTSDAPPVIADVDMDGTYEIFWGNSEGDFFCLNYNGSLKWSKAYGSGDRAPGIGNYSDNPGLEILQFHNGVECMDNEGNQLWYNWPSSYGCVGVVSGDIDGDGYIEIVASFYDKIVCMKTTGGSGIGEIIWPFSHNGLNHNGRYNLVKVPNPATATATGPQGANHDPNITITYTWTDSPNAVDLYYSINNGATWSYLGTDFTVDGIYNWTQDSNPAPKPHKFYWIANAKDSADDVGVPTDNTEPEAGPFNWKTIDISVDTNRALDSIESTGYWTFISVPISINGGVATVLNDTLYGDGGTVWDCAMWYNPTDASNPWKSYRFNRPTSMNDLHSIDNTMGIWLHITQNSGDGFLTVGEGIELSSTSISLLSGWNMVGYPTLNDSMKVSNAFWGTGADRVEVFDPAEPYLIREVGPDYIMQPGEGYWVHVPADTIWTVDW